MLTERQYYSLLERYIKGQSSPEEEKAVDCFFDDLQEEMPISQEEKARRANEIWMVLRQQAERQEKLLPPPPPPPLISQVISGIAASLLLVMAMLLFIKKAPSASEEKSYAQVIRGETVISNNFPKERKYILPDGSVVIVQPQSRLVVKKFGAVRSVVLEGEAFFNIARDVKHPFLVYSEGIVTKVLGTSFSVKSRAFDNTIVVKVKSGKVVVSRQLKGGKINEYRITPNQEIIYYKKANELSVRLQENPQVAIAPAELLKMNFEDAPVTAVFDALEKAYKLDLAYDKKNFEHCRITTSLSNVGLYDKLNIICQLIDAEYETIDTKVYIRGGCKQ